MSGQGFSIRPASPISVGYHRLQAPSQGREGRGMAFLPGWGQRERWKWAAQVGALLKSLRDMVGHCPESEGQGG